ncbi:type VI secretion system ImpC/EvpB family protein [Methylobacterium sp. OAE515]|uniref:type VI secretion system contractile sheath large subunit n=1 Tax=Methylobacterium sp. OAE515 TaxID=2817895 RepID=UPI00178B99C0
MSDTVATGHDWAGRGKPPRPPDRAAAMPGGLRAALLAGRRGSAEQGGFGGALADFMETDAGSLDLWFGSDAAATLRRHPERLRGLIERDVVVIDRLLSTQLDAVLHQPRLQRLEGSWRGLAWLVARFAPDAPLKVRLLTATWRELERDVTRTTEFDQSQLFRKIYENEFGQAGGEPFGLLLVDHEVRHRPERRAPGAAAPVDDLIVVSALAEIAAAAFVPTVLAASPALLGVDRFEDLALSQDVTAALDGHDHARWRAMTRREEARFLCATLPRILARPPWSRELGSVFYTEDTPRSAERVWFVAGYAFAATVGRAFLSHGWPADVRGVGTDRVGGGLVLDLPDEHFVFGAETRWARASIDLALTDRQERDLVAAGLMPLNTLPYGDAAFASVRSIQANASEAPGRDPTPFQANRRISAHVNAMLCVSRFAHYVKVLGRELTGSLTDATAIERRLGQWLAGYTNLTAASSADSRARYPLVSSDVHVREMPGRPGAYGCVIHLQPYHQLDDVSTTFRLVTGIGSSGTAA